MAWSFRLRVAWDECDPDGMAHTANYFCWMDRAIHALMLAAGFGHRATVAALGGITPIVEASVSAKAPVTFDDDLAVETEVVHWGKRSFRIQYRGFRGATLVFEGMEARVWAVIDDGRVRTAVIPDEFRRALVAAAGESP
jgi:4-hydroxybenzoyl-CoA thioesterase